jgi:hypothetical protein
MTASKTDREYFQRIAIQNRKLSVGSAPASLQEAFDRMREIENRLGDLAVSGTARGTTENQEGDLKSHLSYIARLRTIGRR